MRGWLVMPSRFKSKRARIVLGLVLILVVLTVAAFGYYEYRLQQGRLIPSVPKPPLVAGCHEYTKSQGWRTVECLSPEYVRAHIPPPKAHVSPFAQGDGNGVVGVVTGVLSTSTKPAPSAGLESIVIWLCARAECIKAAKMNRASRASRNVKAILFFIFFSS